MGQPQQTQSARESKTMLMTPSGDTLEVSLTDEIQGGGAEEMVLRRNGQLSATISLKDQSDRQALAQFLDDIYVMTGLNER